MHDDNPEGPFEPITGFFPEHPDPVVSDSAAIMLISACETRNVRLVRYALSLTSALGCPDEVMTNVALHGAMRLRTMHTDDITVSPWHFHKVLSPTGDHLWTFEVDEENLSALYGAARAQGLELEESFLAPAIAEARRTGRTICTAANDELTDPEQHEQHEEGHQHDGKATQSLVDSLQAYWPVDEPQHTRWVGIARMAMCCAELAHFGWGNPAGFRPEALDDEG